MTHCAFPIFPIKLHSYPEIPATMTMTSMANNSRWKPPKQSSPQGQGRNHRASLHRHCLTRRPSSMRLSIGQISRDSTNPDSFDHIRSWKYPCKVANSTTSNLVQHTSHSLRTHRELLGRKHFSNVKGASGAKSLWDPDSPVHRSRFSCKGFPPNLRDRVRQVLANYGFGLLQDSSDSSDHAEKKTWQWQANGSSPTIQHQAPAHPRRSHAPHCLLGSPSPPSLNEAWETEKKCHANDEWGKPRNTVWSDCHLEIITTHAQSRFKNWAHIIGFWNTTCWVFWQSGRSDSSGTPMHPSGKDPETKLNKPQQEKSPQSPSSWMSPKYV